MSLIHRAPCQHCPSAHHPPDPELLDCRAYPKEIRVAHHLFVCAWRPTKVCKGLCDFLGVTEADVRRQANEHPESPTGQMVERMQKRARETQKGTVQ